MSRTNQRNLAAILLGPGFDEEPVIYTLCRLRADGLSVTLVGLSQDWIRGFHGLVVKPDASLAALPVDHHFSFVLVPGKEQCGSSLVTSPHFHRLLGQTLNHHGAVAVLKTAESTLNRVGLLKQYKNSGLLTQGDLPLPDFLATLTMLLQQSS